MWPKMSETACVTGDFMNFEYDLVRFGLSKFFDFSSSTSRFPFCSEIPEVSPEDSGNDSISIIVKLFFESPQTYGYFTKFI